MLEDSIYKPFVSFKGEVGAAIREARQALNRGNATRELMTLWGTLWNPWGRDDKEFLKEVDSIEENIIRLDGERAWPRPRKPLWQVRFYSALIGLAQRNDLLDLEMEEEFDRD